MAQRYFIQQLSTLLFGITFWNHLIISAIIRLILILYGHIHDHYAEVPYTDIDYKVVTDGARKILEGLSPFERHTFRYSPLLAYMQIPNILVHPLFGKVIYSCFDLFVAILIYALVRAELQSRGGKRAEEIRRSTRIARLSACFWLYNPLTAVISTRGNGDAISCFFVILTIYLLAKSDDVKSKTMCRRYILIFSAGLSHGFAIHLRIYPLLFSFAYFLSLSKRFSNSICSILYTILLPSKAQLLLILGTLMGLLTTTVYFYELYGWQYIYEAYLYHFVRTDVRHNFSLYFLLQYLGDNAETNILEKILIKTPQFILIFYLTLNFGQFRRTLPFCIFAIAFVMVTFNTVVTSQYFIWYLSLLPLCLNNFQKVPLRRGIGLFLIWLFTQILWLLPAYLLEFKTWNTFYWINLQGAIFFIVNNFILTELIQSFSLAP